VKVSNWGKWRVRGREHDEGSSGRFFRASIMSAKKPLRITIPSPT
jgi:hypothetical protein